MTNNKSKYTSSRSGHEMSLFVNAPQEEAFRSMMDYFTGRRMKNTNFKLTFFY